MISGFDRYFQIVRCFRDEDLRSERQPEFTQIDIEMSFIDREDVYSLVDGMLGAIFDVIGGKVGTPIPRLTFEESMERYGTDKPDLRIEAEITDLTAESAGFQAEVIRKVLASGGAVKALRVPGAAGMSRSQLDKLGQKAQELGAKGIVWSRIRMGSRRVEARGGGGGPSGKKQGARRRPCPLGRRPARVALPCWGISAGTSFKPRPKGFAFTCGPIFPSSSGARRKRSSPSIILSHHRGPRTSPSSNPSRSR
jgi:hypothetical protein